MGFRGVVRDILSIYLGYKLILVWLFGVEFSSDIGIIGLILLIIAIWFIFERVGVLPKL